MYVDRQYLLSEIYVVESKEEGIVQIALSRRSLWWLGLKMLAALEYPLALDHKDHSRASTEAMGSMVAVQRLP